MQIDELCNETVTVLNRVENSTIFTDYSDAREFFIQNCSEYWWNSTDAEDPAYFSHIYRFVGTFFQGIIFLVGFIGNIMVVLVVAKTKSMHSPTNCYLVSLAIADIVVLVAAVPNEIITYYLLGGRWYLGELGCSLVVFSQNLGINASSLSLTAFTIERYIAICHPMKAQTFQTFSRAKRITACVWLFSIIYCAPWLSLTQLISVSYKGFEDVKKCDFKLSREAYLSYFVADIFVFYIFPLLLSVVLYSLIARILFRSREVSSTIGGKSNGPLTVDSTKTNAARVQVVKMLVMVVVIFAVLWLPYRGMLVYNSFAPMFGRETFMDLWFLMLVKTCIYINSAINPILYNAMSVKFRRAFSRTLSCGKRNEENMYGRWGYGRTTQTFTCASTALPSSSTLSCHMNRVVTSSTSTSGTTTTTTTTTTTSTKSKNHDINKKYININRGTSQVKFCKNINQPLLDKKDPPIISYTTSVDVIVDSRGNEHSLSDEEENFSYREAMTQL